MITIQSIYKSFNEMKGNEDSKHTDSLAIISIYELIMWSG